MLSYPSTHALSKVIMLYLLNQCLLQLSDQYNSIKFLPLLVEQGRTFILLYWSDNYSRHWINTFVFNRL